MCVRASTGGPCGQEASKKMRTPLIFVASRGPPPHCYWEPSGGLRLPVPMSNNEGRVVSYKAFLEKASQPRRQEAYKHPTPALQPGASDRIT